MLGLIGRKVGMTQVFDDKGRVTPVTVIKVEPNLVVAHRTEEKDGYSAIILGADEIRPSRSTKPYLGQFGDMKPQRCLFEMRDYEKECQIGDTLSVDLFNDALFLDVVGTSKGKGTKGVVRKYGFGGGRATHGSKFHRENGSTGCSTTPHRTHKGRKMAGQLGDERVTVQNLKIIKVDAQQQLVMVKGAVPGNKGGFLLLRRSVKKG
jgi:large subunit ribosomal protein L3